MRSARGCRVPADYPIILPDPRATLEVHWHAAGRTPHVCVSITNAIANTHSNINLHLPTNIEQKKIRLTAI